jgi:hypothetical protein
MIVLFRISPSGKATVEASQPAFTFIPYGVVVNDDVAYVAVSWPSSRTSGAVGHAKDGGLQIIDFRTPGVLTHLGNYRTQLDDASAANGFDIGIAQVGDVLALGLGEKVMRVFDVNDEHNPRAIQSERLAGDIGAMAAVGNYLFVSGHLDGLDVYRRTGNPIPLPTPTDEQRTVYLPLIQRQW